MKNADGGEGDGKVDVHNNLLYLIYVFINET